MMNKVKVHLAYRTLWSIAVLTHGSTRLRIHTTTEGVIEPLKREKMEYGQLEL